MATYEYTFDSVIGGAYFEDPSMFFGTIEWPAGASTIDYVQAKISSGNATFNFVEGPPVYAGNAAKDISENMDLRWHFRAKDLGASTPTDGGPTPQYHRTPNSSIDIWYDSCTDGPSFRQATSSEQPSFDTDDGISNGSNRTDAVYFSGFEHFVSYQGDFSVPYNQNFSIVTLIGDFGSGTYRPILGQDNTAASSGVGSVYGDWGRYRIRKRGGEEYYNPNGGLNADNQIRVCTVEYDSTNNKYICNEYINGTKSSDVDDEEITSATTNDWVFDMFGAFKYNAGPFVYTTRYQGGITEQVFYDYLLTTNDRELVEGTLAHQYDVANLLPSGHTYKTLNPFNPSWRLATDSTLSSSYGNTLSTAATLNISKRAELSFALTRGENAGSVTVKIVTT